MIIIYSANDYKIMFIMAQNECINELKAFTIDKIKELTGLSIPKIRLSIKTFINDEYIKEGVRHHNAKTYFVSKKGLEKVKELSE